VPGPRGGEPPGRGPILFFRGGGGGGGGGLVGDSAKSFFGAKPGPNLAGRHGLEGPTPGILGFPARTGTHVNIIRNHVGGLGVGRGAGGGAPEGPLPRLPPFFRVAGGARFRTPPRGGAGPGGPPTGPRGHNPRNFFFPDTPISGPFTGGFFCAAGGAIGGGRRAGTHGPCWAALRGGGIAILPRFFPPHPVLAEKAPL